MRPLRIAGAAVMAALALAACERQRSDMVNSAICADFKSTPSSTPASGDASGTVDDCVRRWAYSLAGARDPADAVANAAVTACGRALTVWNRTALGQPAPVDSTGAPVADPVSIESGQPTNALAAHTAFAHRQALLYVIQARAGQCAPPPIKKGVPVGT